MHCFSIAVVLVATAPVFKLSPTMDSVSIRDNDSLSFNKLNKIYTIVLPMPQLCSYFSFHKGIIQVESRTDLYYNWSSEVWPGLSCIIGVQYH